MLSGYYSPYLFFVKYMDGVIVPYTQKPWMYKLANRAYLQLEKGQSVTIRINGTNTLKSLWSVQRIVISSNLKEYSYAIDSPDSSLIRFATSMLDSVIKLELKVLLIF